jgi:hypothetical protein
MLLDEATLAGTSKPTHHILRDVQDLWMSYAYEPHPSIVGAKLFESLRKEVQELLEGYLIMAPGTRSSCSFTEYSLQLLGIPCIATAWDASMQNVSEFSNI